MARYDVLHEIQRLDPERDNQRIMHLSFGYEFPWDSVRALEIALYRTYCIPTVSGLLDRTQEFYRHPQRRYDDTAILIAEMCEWGYEQGRGKEALERMNWVHGHFKISNDDFLYVLSTFVYEPIRWIDSFAWRRLCQNERLAYFYFWRDVGRRMGIRDLPPTSAAFAAWTQEYERTHFRFVESNRKIATATRDLFASWFPRLATRLVHASIHALLDDSMLRAFGFPRPLPATRALIRAALRLRGRIVRWLPPRRRPHFFTDSPNRTYPQGYGIAALGPPRFVAQGKMDRVPQSTLSRVSWDAIPGRITTVGAWRVGVLFRPLGDETWGGDRFSVERSADGGLVCYVADAPGHGASGARFWELNQDAFLAAYRRFALEPAQDALVRFASEVNDRLHEANLDGSSAPSLSQLCMWAGTISGKGNLLCVNFGLGIHVLAVTDQGLSWPSPEAAFGFRLGWFPSSHWTQADRSLVIRRIPALRRLAIAGNAFFGDDHRDPRAALEKARLLGERISGMTLDQTLDHVQQLPHDHDDATFLIVEPA